MWTPPPQGTYRRIVLLALPILLAAPASAFSPSFQPEVETSRTAEPIRIDGVLDDVGWNAAGRATGFVERSPGENVEPLVPTEAYITYDDDHVYAAFVCTDDPATVRATMCQRDQYNRDDAVGLLIDTYGDGVWAYEFFVNPYGIQKDLMWTSVQGDDVGFDMIWHSASQITDDGWVVEMAIPLAGMRFPDGDLQNWRLDFWRIHPRDSYRQYSWSALDPDDQCWPCQWGSVDGIEGVTPGKGFEVLGSFVGSRSGEIADPYDAESGVVDGDWQDDYSLGAKYSPASNVTLEASVNPDYSQIEADAAQIDVNTTIQLLFPERRPFFQEGNDLFRTMFNSFYTRMVSDPDMAAKATARWDRTSVGWVMARDENSPYIVPAEERSYTKPMGRSTVNVVRGLHSFGTNSQIGGMVTDRRYDDGGSGTIISGDARLRLTNSLHWVGQFVHSRTEEPEGVEVAPGATFADGRHTYDLDGESFSGNALITQLRHQTRRMNVVLDYNQVAADYRTQTGYDPWNNQRNAYVWAGYNFYPQGGPFQRISPSLFTNGRWNFEGDQKWRHNQAQLNTWLRWAQTFVSLRYQAGQETWGDKTYDDLWSLTANAQMRPNAAVGLFGYVQYGENPARLANERGDELTVSLGLDLKPFDRLTIEPSLDFIRSELSGVGDLLFEQTIARARFQLQVDPRLSLRLVVQHIESESPLYNEQDWYHLSFGSKWEIDPLMTYRLNSFSVFYLGSTHDWRDFNAADPALSSLHTMTARKYFTKIQYLFQI